MRCTYLLTSLILVILSSVAGAQPNLKNAYVVRSAGDTLYGFVNYKEWDRTPARFSFVSGPEKQTKQMLSVKEIQTLNIVNLESYERFVVPISMNSIDLHRGNFVPDTSNKKDTVFLKKLVQGDRINLYSYRDYLKERYYVLQHPSAQPVELQYAVEIEGLDITSNYAYRKQLEQMAAIYPEYSAALQQQLEQTAYTKNEIRKIVNKINRDSDEKSDNAVKKISKGRFLVQAGVNMSTLAYRGNNQVNAAGLGSNGQPAYKEETVVNSILPVIAAGYELYLKPSIRRTYVRTLLELGMLRSKIHSFYKFPAPYDEELNNRYSMSALTVSLHPQFFYNLYHRETFKIQLGGGLSVTKAHFLKNTLEQYTNKQGAGYSDKFIENSFNYRKLSLVPTITAGVLAGDRFGVTFVWYKSSELMQRDTAPDKEKVKMSSVQLRLSFAF